MATNLFDLSFDVSGPSDNGTLVATCRELPMIVAAMTEDDLRLRVANAINQLSTFLTELGAERDDYLSKAGVKLRDDSAGTARTRTLTFPVTVEALAG